jgi:hypothetical protein
VELHEIPSDVMLRHFPDAETVYHQASDTLGLVTRINRDFWLVWHQAVFIESPIGYLSLIPIELEPGSATAEEAVFTLQALCEPVSELDEFGDDINQWVYPVVNIRGESLRTIRLLMSAIEQVITAFERVCTFYGIVPRSGAESVHYDLGG